MRGEIESLLERSEELESLRGALAAAEAGGGGRLILVAGEAGIGKTALLRELCRQAGRTRVMWGACDALHTPRPLGPLLDVAGDEGGQLAAVIAEGSSPSAVAGALANDLRRRSPTILVLEDLHWADEATLDAVRLLARRIDSLRVLVVVTYRDDAIDRTHAARMLLGELAGRPAVDRLSVPALSLEAVGALAEGRGVDVDLLHERTAGNPFFVTEVLASGGADVPVTVRDAVLARAARLDGDARALIDAVAVVPGGAEMWLLEALAGEQLAALERCIASGMLNTAGGTVGFRHEIARVAIETALPLDRAVNLHRAALAALTAVRRGAADPARLAHHAEMAGDVDAVLSHAPAAGERAARVHAHREAAAQFERALRFAEALSPERRAGLLERFSYESYLIDRIPDAIDARRRALDEYVISGDRLRQGDTHRWLSRLVWFTGDNHAAEREAAQAVALLEALPPGRELAMAYSNTAQLRMLASDIPGTVEWGGRAIELAERLGETEILVHALNNAGTAESRRGRGEGFSMLQRSLELALAAGLEDHVARAYVNLSSAAIEVRDYALADRALDSGIAYCRQRDLDTYGRYMMGWRARAALEQGRLDDATETALGVLRDPAVAAGTRITALVVLGLVRARRGDPDVWTALDEALALAEPTGELQRVVPVACARAEARWLVGQIEAIVAETDRALTLALQRGDRWATGELLVWRSRAGVTDAASDEQIFQPIRLELRRDRDAAAEAWHAIGCPYEAALALASGDDPAQLRQGLAELQRLGAHAAARRVARTLREQGVRDVRMGPRRAARANPAGLTPRELEVLALLAEGRRNADIAAALFVSERTVGHHVSAILRKLGARTRGEAASKATALGIAGR